MDLQNTSRQPQYQPAIEIIEQCAWCGLIENGPHAGERADLSVGDTHGMCEPCFAQQLAALAKLRREVTHN